MKAFIFKVARGVLSVQTRLEIRWLFMMPDSRAYLLKRMQRRLTGKSLRVHFYPHDPRTVDPTYTVRLICRRAGFIMSSGERRAKGLVMRFEDTTVGSVPEHHPVFERAKCALNARCQDISKKRVEKIFSQVFGYTSFVNPEAASGRCVKKSDTNGHHDGQIVDCPVEHVEEGYVYQKLFNSSRGDGFVEEMRLPVFGGEIPLVLNKIKYEEDRFRYSIDGTLEKPEAMLSEKDRANLSDFCRAFGLDYGELDVIRDRDDGRIYVLDVNNTPTIHFAGYSSEEEAYSMSELAAAFEKSFGTSER